MEFLWADVYKRQQILGQNGNTGTDNVLTRFAVLRMSRYPEPTVLPIGIYK